MSHNPKDNVYSTADELKARQMGYKDRNQQVNVQVELDRQADVNVDALNIVKKLTDK